MGFGMGFCCCNPPGDDCQIGCTPPDSFVLDLTEWTFAEYSPWPWSFLSETDCDSDLTFLEAIYSLPRVTDPTTKEALFSEVSGLAANQCFWYCEIPTGCTFVSEWDSVEHDVYLLLLVFSDGVGPVLAINAGVTLTDPLRISYGVDDGFIISIGAGSGGSCGELFHDGNFFTGAASLLDITAPADPETSVSIKSWEEEDPEDCAFTPPDPPDDCVCEEPPDTILLSFNGTEDGPECCDDLIGTHVMTAFPTVDDCSLRFVAELEVDCDDGTFVCGVFLLEITYNAMAAETTPVLELYDVDGQLVNRWTGEPMAGQIDCSNFNDEIQTLPDALPANAYCSDALLNPTINSP